MSDRLSHFATAERRWGGIGPYFAMFPTAFAERVIRNHTDLGDIVLDPFAGRGTSVYGAAINGRIGVGIEINPVGWVYAKAKLQTANRSSVTQRLADIGRNSRYYRIAADNLPPFFKKCYTQDVRAFLLAARTGLNWRQCKVDWTLMALLLVHLHGKRTDSFSNQMRQTKSMSPPYAIRWWKQHGHKPPEIDPVHFMKGKLAWRYAKGTPSVTPSKAYLGDSVVRLAQLSRTTTTSEANGKAQLLFTSPPYCGITNYHYDQWLRLWLLGGPSMPVAPNHPSKGKFVDRTKYRELLRVVFERASRLLADSAVIYVRTDARRLTRDITCDVLREVFSDMHMRRYKQSTPQRTQTDLFGSGSKKSGETDIVLRRR